MRRYRRTTTGNCALPSGEPNAGGRGGSCPLVLEWGQGRVGSHTKQLSSLRTSVFAAPTRPAQSLRLHPRMTQPRPHPHLRQRPLKNFVDRDGHLDGLALQQGVAAAGTNTRRREHGCGSRPREAHPRGQSRAYDTPRSWQKAGLPARPPAPLPPAPPFTPSFPAHLPELHLVLLRHDHLEGARLARLHAQHACGQRSHLHPFKGSAAS